MRSIITEYQKFPRKWLCHVQCSFHSSSSFSNQMKQFNGTNCWYSVILSIPFINDKAQTNAKKAIYYGEYSNLIHIIHRRFLIGHRYRKWRQTTDDIHRNTPNNRQYSQICLITIIWRELKLKKCTVSSMIMRVWHWYCIRIVQGSQHTKSSKMRLFFITKCVSIHEIE